MKNVLPALLKVSIFTGVLLFSLYAFNVNENKKSSELRANIQKNAEKSETLEQVNKSKVANLQGRINSMNKGRHDRYKTLMIMFPDEMKINKELMLCLKLIQKRTTKNQRQKRQSLKRSPQKVRMNNVPCDQ